MSAMDDVFGMMPNRPSSPSFWKLSQVVLRLDGAMEAAPTKEEKNAVWEATVKEIIDIDALTYMAFQRAMRAVGATTVADIMLNLSDIAKFTAVFLDGFIMGASYAKEG